MISRSEVLPFLAKTCGEKIVFGYVLIKVQPCLVQIQCTSSWNKDISPNILEPLPDSSRNYN